MALLYFHSHSILRILILLLFPLSFIFFYISLFHHPFSLFVLSSPVFILRIHLIQRGFVMEKILALYDNDQHYSERLGRFLESRSELPFRVCRFQDPEKLRQFSDRHGIDVLLSDEHCAREVRDFCAPREMICLRENDGTDPDDGSIYKFQSGEGILRELLKHYAATPTPERRGHARLYLIFSPLGRIGKSCFALTLARLLSRECSTLYLSLEENAAFAAGQTLRHSGTLSEALYYHKQNMLDPARLQSLLYDAEGLSYIPPVRNPEDLSALSPGELSAFVDTLRSSAFHALVVDTDTLISRAAALFPLAEKVFIPVREDSASRQKLARFEDFLSHARLLKEPEHMIRLLLPQDDSISDAAALLTQSRPGPLTDYAQAVLRNYIL